MLELEADKWSKHIRYRLKGKAGTKRHIPMSRVKSLPTRFYQLKSRHEQIGDYLKQFGHPEDDKYSLCGLTVSRTHKHFNRHCSWLRVHQRELWKVVGKAMGWKAGLCREVQISVPFAIEESDQAVMDFLVATEVGKFLPK